MISSRSLGAPLVASALLTLTGVARAETFEVGPGKAFATLSEVADSLAPGDVVEIDGGTTYTEDVSLSASGEANAPITIRGAGGARPVLSGQVYVTGDHIVLESLEIRDGAPTCLSHAGDDLVVRDVAVHDCPNHGILGADQGSGSLLLDAVEVYRCAQVQEGNRKHQIYIATDEVAHPGAVFRMQHSYVHDCGNDGSNIKSRAERTELYFNWIENGGLYEVELYGPDQDGVPDGWSEDLAREDADVVGNVFLRTGNQATDFLFRIGGDGAPDLGDAGPNDTKGRVRLLANTFVAPGGTGVFRTFNRVESVEVHGNVFFGDGGGLRMLDDEAEWVGGSPIVAGDHNWIRDDTDDMPEGWTDSLTGDDPGFVDLAGGDLHPREGSPLVDAGSLPTVSPSGVDFPNPLAVPLDHPPAHAPEASGAAEPRPEVGTVDIGAYEYGEGPPRSSGNTGGAGPGAGPGSGGNGPAGAGGDGAGSGAAPTEDDGCDCRSAGTPASTRGGLGALALIALAAWRRRKLTELRTRAQRR